YGAMVFPHEPAIVIYDSYKHLKVLLLQFFGLSSPTLIPMPTLVVWLRLERPLYPPQPGRFWKPDQFRELILERLSRETREELFKILTRRSAVRLKREEAETDASFGRKSYLHRTSLI